MWHKIATNFTFQVFIVLLYVHLMHKCIHCMTAPRERAWLQVLARDQTCPNCAWLHSFTVPTCICTRLKSISWGSSALFLHAGAEIKRLTTCSTVLATDVPEQITERTWRHVLKMWMRIFKLWCEQDLPWKKMLCSCDSHGLNNRAHTYYMPTRDFFVSALRSGDLRIFCRMETELFG